MKSPDLQADRHPVRRTMVAVAIGLAALTGCSTTVAGNPSPETTISAAPTPQAAESGSTQESQTEAAVQQAAWQVLSDVRRGLNDCESAGADPALTCVPTGGADSLGFKFTSPAKMRTASIDVAPFGNGGTMFTLHRASATGKGQDAKTTRLDTLVVTAPDYPPPDPDMPHLLGFFVGGGVHLDVVSVTGLDPTSGVLTKYMASGQGDIVVSSGGPDGSAHQVPLSPADAQSAMLGQLGTFKQSL